MEKIPKHTQIFQYYAKMIDSKILKPDEKMPTEEEIGILFNVSRITVRKALDSLCQSGHIYKIHGKGSFVAHKKTNMQLNHLIGFSEEMRLLGKSASSRILSQELVEPPDSVAQALELGKGQKVYLLVRLRLADGNPMAIEKAYLPFHRFPGLEYDAEESLYAILSQKYGCDIGNGEQSIYADRADKREAELLTIKPFSPVLRISRVTYEKDGKPFEDVFSTYRGDQYIFKVRLGRDGSFVTV